MTIHEDNPSRLRAHGPCAVVILDVEERLRAFLNTLEDILSVNGVAVLDRSEGPQAHTRPRLICRSLRRSWNGPGAGARWGNSQGDWRRAGSAARDGAALAVGFEVTCAGTLSGVGTRGWGAHPPQLARLHAPPPPRPPRA